MLARKLPLRAWQRLSAGPGAKGHRWYDWAWVSVDQGLARAPLAADPPPPARPASWPITAATRPALSLAVLVRAAGRRWTVEEDFQASKGLAGLDEHQVRRWASWYRWVTLAMLALAFLTVAPWPSTPSPRRPA